MVGEVLQKLWGEAVVQTGDHDLGLHIGEAFDLAAIGIVGYVMLNCKTYRQVLEKLCQYTQLFSRGVTLRYQVVDSWVYCDCDIVGGFKITCWMSPATRLKVRLQRYLGPLSN